MQWSASGGYRKCISAEVTGHHERPQVKGDKD
jgi:hypothetical protein